MPELPEVETVKRGLAPLVVGETVESVALGNHRVIKSDPNLMVRELPGQTVLGLSRRGKYLICELTHHLLILHLGMTGQLTVTHPAGTGAISDSKGSVNAGAPAPDRHTHLIIRFRGGKVILFRDTRTFGKVILADKRAQSASLPMEKLGIEPFTPEYNLAAFLKGFRGRKLKFKSLLLDQRFVAGVGNIYADEALFESGINPVRTSKSLNPAEKIRLFEAILLVLERGIVSGGTTLRDFLNPAGDPGSHQEQLNVYGRPGQPCRRCAEVIQKIVVGQRGTHFCPRCQPRRPARGPRPDRRVA